MVLYKTPRLSRLQLLKLSFPVLFGLIRLIRTIKLIREKNKCLHQSALDGVECWTLGL